MLLTIYTLPDWFVPAGRYFDEVATALERYQPTKATKAGQRRRARGLAGRAARRRQRAKERT